MTPYVKGCLVLFLAVQAVASFGGGDDKFLKKYAMMKIYESCFGPEVIKQVRAEMKAACAKCATLSSGPPPFIPTNQIVQDFQPNSNYINQNQLNRFPNNQQQINGFLSNQNGFPSNQNQLNGFSNNQNQLNGFPNSQNQLNGYPAIVPNQNNLNGFPANQNGYPIINPVKIHPNLPPPSLDGSINYDKIDLDTSKAPQIQPNIDAEKLQQAILAFKQNTLFQQTPLQGPVGRPSGYSAVPSPQIPLFTPWGNHLYPSGAWGAPLANPYSGYSAGPAHMSSFYPQYYQGRVSRDIDFRERLEMFAARTQTGNTPHNITCVMQELGYLDANLEPSVDSISARIRGLPVPADLKEDMLEGLDYCQKFSQCVPETKPEKSPLSRELVKPMFFFRCYKHKKLEACVMKDVRERFSSDDAIDSNLEELRAQHGRSLHSKPEHNMADMFFDFLYGGNNDMDVDTFM